MRLAPLGLSLLATAALAGPDAKAEPAANPKRTTVVCTIRSLGKEGVTRVHLDAPCRFFPTGGGSFSLSALAMQAPPFEGIWVVSVTVVAPGQAEVRGLTDAGINSRWGEARRSKKDPACWTGSDFEICARRKG